MLTDLSVQFDYGLETYVPGSIVSGDVVVCVAEPIRHVRYILVQCIGKSLVRWAETQGEKTQLFADGERYFKMETHAFDEGSVNSKLDKGKHRFPFSFQLPANIPASFQFKATAQQLAAARVRYAIKAIVKRSVLGGNFKVARAFFVSGSVNVAGMDRSSTASGAARPCDCCPDKLHGTVTTDRSGYLPGDTVSVQTNLEDVKCRESLRKMLNLSMRVKVRGRLFEARLAQLEPDSTPWYNRWKSYDDWFMPIPTTHLGVPLAPTGLAHCDIIDLEYFIEFVVDVSDGRHDNLRVAAPVAIGSENRSLATPSSGERSWAIKQMYLPRPPPPVKPPRPKKRITFQLPGSTTIIPQHSDQSL